MQSDQNVIDFLYWGGRMKNSGNEKGMKKMVSRVIMTICLSVFIYSAYELSIIGFGYYKNRQVLAEVQHVYKQLEKEENDEGNTEIRKQFESLHEINPDIVGWITIDDTKINYPIVQAEDNEFYLTRNYKQENSKAGSIFLDYRNELLEEEKNMILYGHRMKDETMFQQLTKYADQNFFETHSIIYIDTLYAGYDVEVFSVYYTTTDFDYIQTEFTTDEEIEQFFHSIKQKSMYKTDVGLNSEDTIITLSTCDSTLDKDEGRFVVHAKLIKRQ